MWNEGTEAAISALLVQANGRRTARLLSIAEVKACLAEALPGRGETPNFLWRHGGEVDDERDFTTVVMVVVGRDEVTVGVSSSHARGVTPGRAWPDELEPWDRYKDSANLPRCLAWAGRPKADRIRLPRILAAAPIDVTPSALLEQILARPDEDAPRLVYADWLSERGNPRGELISVQCELERTKDPDRFLELEARQVALLSAHETLWLGPSAAESLQVNFRRGFVEQVSVHDPRALPVVEQLCTREPVQSLTVASTRGLDVSRLAAAPWLHRLQALALRATVRDSGLSAEAIGTLLESRSMRGLSSLALRGHRLGDVGALVLAANVPSALPALEALILEDDEVSEVGAQGLASTRWLAELKTLSLADNRLGEGGTEAIAFARRPGQLRSLDLSGNALGSAGAAILARAPRLTSLEVLRLARNRIGSNGVEALLDSPFLQGLKVLTLDGNPMGQALRRRVEALGAFRTPAG